MAKLNQPRDPAPVEAINWEYDDITPWALRRADDDAAQALEWVYGDDWRERRLRLIDAAHVMVCTPNAAYLRMIYKRRMAGERGPWDITFGMVFDYQKRVNGRVMPLDYDNLWEWGRKYHFLLARHRWLCIRFLRAAYAARTAGLPIEEAEFTSHQWLWWGVNYSRLARWQGQPGQDKWWWDRIRIAYYHRRDGSQHKLRIYNVGDALEWFILESAIQPESRVTKDFLRDRYRMAENGIRDWKRSMQAVPPVRTLNEPANKRWRKKMKGNYSHQWIGAVGLQHAWNAYHRMAQVEFGHAPGTVRITPNRLHTYLSQTLELLATNDPDWKRRPIDLATIKPDHRYAVLLPAYRAFEQDTEVHTPAGAQLIQVFHEAKARVTLVKNAQSSGQPQDRVVFTTGAHIHRFPHAYTA